MNVVFPVVVKCDCARCRTSCVVVQTLYVGGCAGSLYLFDALSCEAFQVPSSVLTKSKAAVVLGQCKPDGTVACVTTDKLVSTTRGPEFGSVTVVRVVRFRCLCCSYCSCVLGTRMATGCFSTKRRTTSCQ